jgi:uncharacterized protein
MNDEARALIARFELEPLPDEGGFFKRTWTSSVKLPHDRSVGSAIMFLLTDTDFSALHRLETDELWCFHAGDAVEHVQLGGAKSGPVITLIGASFHGGETPQLIVPGGNWQGARLLPHGHADRNPHARKGWALFSCVMAPAWDEREFTLGVRAELTDLFPFANDWIEALTR